VRPAIQAGGGQGADCLASDVDVYDGDFRSHTLLSDGEVLDRFCSIPDCFLDDPAEIADPDVILDFWRRCWPPRDSFRTDVRTCR
jgi:hypothetical protein